MRVQQALMGISSGQLARIAAAWELPVEAGTLRRELAEQVATHLLNITQDEAFWAAQDNVSRQILGMLVRAGGRHEADLLARRLAHEQPATSDPDEAAARTDAATAELVERGLLFRIFETAEQREGVYLLLPEDLLAAAREHLDAPSPRTWPTPAPPPGTVVVSRLGHDLFVLASALRRETLSAASRGLAGRSARSVGQIVGRLRERSGDGPGQPGQRWRFLLWVAQRAGWISRGVWPNPDETALELLLGSPHDLPAQALAAGPVRAPASSGRLLATERESPRRIQADALQLLSELPADSWWQADDLVAWLAGQIISEQPAPGARSRPPGHQAATIRRWLAGRWFWLGLVAWGQDAHGWSLIQPARALRTLTRGGQASEDRPAPAACLLDGDRAFIAPPGADLAVLYRAEPYLSYADLGDGRRRYTLSPPSLERGLRHGGSVERLADLLEALLQQPLPDDWRRNIDAWNDESTRLRLTAGLILSSDDSAALAAAKALPAAREAIVEELSPTHVRVAGEPLATMLADLAAAGLPVEIDPGVRAEPVSAGRAAALAGGAAEAAWIGLELARRLASDVVEEQRDLTTARLQLEAVLSAGRIEALERRVTTIVAAIANRKSSRSRRRVV